MSVAEQARWRKATEPVYAKWIKDMDAKGLPGKQMVAEAEQLVAKYKAQAKAPNEQRLAGRHARAGADGRCPSWWRAAALTVVSVIGRYGFGAPVPGDYELVEIACAVGVFLFFPYTQAVGGNISRGVLHRRACPRARKRVLDLGNEVVFALVALLLTWRLAAGLLDKYASGETSILIGIPAWWAYGVAVVSMALLTLVCLMRVVAGGPRR